MLLSTRRLLACGRDQRGFGMIELLAAMVVMSVGVMAVYGLFQSGLVNIRRASTITTAAALAEAEMERFRALRYDTLGLDPAQTCPSGCSAADVTYRGDAAYSTDTSPSTTVTGTFTASSTTLTVASAASFPAAGEFRVTIESEILLVTDGAGTTTWTVTRGVDGTTPASHSAGAAVVLKKRVDVAPCPATPCSDLVPTKSSVGADGANYRVDTYVTWEPIANQAGTAGRALKRLTVVVRDAASPYREWARVTSIFDEATGS